MRTILSGIQPSGSLHIGNYFGFIDGYVRSQQELTDHKFLLMIADLHSMSSRLLSNRKDIIDLAVCYLAAASDSSSKATMFVQSSIAMHSELMWLLSCVTPLGLLNRMTQFKDKTAKCQDAQINLALLSYPVLMASDILLYQADSVQVAADQKQHMEFVRDIATIFNNTVGAEVFVIPNIILSDKRVSRIMSLDDGRKKMSKSNASTKACIYLSDDDDTIRNKIMSAKTDSYDNIYYDIDSRPEVSNLLNLFSFMSNISIDDIGAKYSGGQMAKFKRDLADLLIDKLAPLKEKMSKLYNNIDYVECMILRGTQEAKDIANTSMKVIRDKLNIF